MNALTLAIFAIAMLFPGHEKAARITTSIDPSGFPTVWTLKSKGEWVCSLETPKRSLLVGYHAYNEAKQTIICKTPSGGVDTELTTETVAVASLYTAPARPAGKAGAKKALPAAITIGGNVYTVTREENNISLTAAAAKVVGPVTLPQVITISYDIPGAVSRDND